MEIYHGPFGETVRATDEVGAEFLRHYRHAAEKMGREGRREAMAMLALVVHAAGGQVEVPFGWMARLGTGGLSMTIAHDPTDHSIILTTTE